MTFTPIHRRKFLGLGAASAFGLMAGGHRVLADVLSEATVVGSDEMAKPRAKDGKLRIGFSNGFSGNTWRTMCLEQMKNEAAANADRYELIVVDGQGDVTKQVNDLEDLMAQQVDAILCIPNSGAAVVPVLGRAQRSGIVTVPFNLPVEGERWDAFVGTDPRQKGEILGRNMTEMLGNNGKIVALGGLPGNGYTAEAWAGAQSQLGTGIEVLAFKDAYWEEDRAKVVMADLIAAYPQIDGIWADGGQMASGALKALKAAGRPLVPVTGDDYNGLLKLYDAEHAAEPKLAMSLVSEPSWEGVFALRTAVDLLSGIPRPKRQIISPTEITSESYGQYIKTDLPDGVFVDTLLSDDELAALFG